MMVVVVGGEYKIGNCFNYLMLLVGEECGIYQSSSSRRRRRPEMRGVG